MSSTRLYLKNLPCCAKNDVFSYLERFGKLTELKIIEKDSGRFGFAQYASEQDAKFVLDAFKGRLFLGHKTVIEPARPLRKDMPWIESRSSDESSSTRNETSSRYPIQPTYYSNRAHPCRYPVLVTDIPRRVCWQELKDFGRLSGGAVAFCNLDRERPGNGFIEYLSQEAADEAISMLNGQRLGGRAVTVSAYTRATRRTDRSRSPIRRRRYEVDASKASDGDKRRDEFPASASCYSAPESSENVASSRDSRPYYSTEPVPPPPIVVHPELYTFSQTVESYRTGQFHCDPAADQGPLTLPVSSSFDSTQPLSVFDFDAYLRLSYDRRLQHLPESYSSLQ
ncbi:hypothetical protein C8R46DRAFT_1072960 [Mycena filopes]|nr:hypothetical protein C8R46DRAFT_1072960 [Mycena filopes]